MRRTLACLAVALGLPASAAAMPIGGGSSHAVARPAISSVLFAHWSNVPFPTGTVTVTAHVRGASKVTASAAHNTWKLKRANGRGSGYRKWKGTIRKAAVTNYFGRPTVKFRVKACNRGGCVSRMIRLRNA